MEPITTALTTAGEIVELLVKAGAGEAGKRLTVAAFESIKKLRDQIYTKFQGDTRAEKALQELERQRTDVQQQKVSNYLENAMLEDEEFSSSIQKTAQIVVNEIISQSETSNFDRWSMGDGNHNINILSIQLPYTEKSGKEAKGERNDPNELDYTLLQQLLRSNEWLDADRETHRLMLQAKGKDKENWLRDQEIIYFPCNTLQEIDRLWVGFSNGRFGFSVQLDIFLSCNLMGIEFNDAAWYKFQKKVGWLTRKHILASYELTLPYRTGETNLLRGCLPFWTTFLVGENLPILGIPVSEGWFRRFLYLGWRLRHCDEKNNG